MYIDNLYMYTVKTLFKILNNHGCSVHPLNNMVVQTELLKYLNISV